MSSLRSVEDRVKMVLLFGAHKTVAGVIRNWNSVDVPDRLTIRNTINRFLASGNVSPAPRTGRPPSALDEDGMDLILQSVHDNPELSVRKRARETGISKSTISRAIRNLGFRAYRCQVVQELKETDYERRMSFSVEWLEMLERHEEVQDRILWTDECRFGLDETVNTRNCYYYSEMNPHYHREIPLKQEGAMAWCGISSFGIIGPFFFSSTVTAKSYHHLLVHKIMPAAKKLFGNDDFWFQQDGAPAHTSNLATKYLDKKKPEKWIGKRGPVQWPPRSPDLTPPDFFLCGYPKDRVYESRPTSVEELKSAIIEIALEIPLDMCQRTCRSVKERLIMLQQAEGGHLLI